MKILLVAMPDAVSALDTILKIPNLGLSSLAGNLPKGEVRILDLAFKRKDLDRLLGAILDDFQPDVVGLSAMSFQFSSAVHVARLVKSLLPETKTVIGGYHATLMAEEIGGGPHSRLFDFIIRGEGELTFAALVERLASGGDDFSNIPGLSFGGPGFYRHNPPASLLALEALRLPDRDCRILGGPRFLDLKFDCAETSRGCPLQCKFCSISCMYGRTIRNFSLERVVEDLQGLKAKGTDGVFFVDDNITLDGRRLKKLCGLIVEEKLNTMKYVMQAAVPGIAADPELPDLLAEAGFRWVFLGIESPLERNLKDMRKPGTAGAAGRAVKLLRERGICVFAGLIVGSPQDTRRDVATAFKFASEIGADHAIVQCLTPYPKTEMRQELFEAGLVTNAENFDRYNGFICNVRTQHLTTRALSRAIVLSGIKLYFRPGYMIRSRLWRRHPSLIWPLLLNNLRFVTEGWRNCLFASSHSW